MTPTARRLPIRHLVTFGILVSLVGCSGDGGNPAAGPGATDASVEPPAPGVTRWWDAPAGVDGTGAELEDYCASLRQTEERKALGPLDAATDPAALPTLLLWVTETGRAAPPEVAEAWTPLEGFVRALAEAPIGSVPPDSMPDPTALAEASTLIRDHAAASCGVTLTIL